MTRTNDTTLALAPSMRSERSKAWLRGWDAFNAALNGEPEIENNYPDDSTHWREFESGYLCAVKAYAKTEQDT